MYNLCFILGLYNIYELCVILCLYTMYEPCVILGLYTMQELFVILVLSTMYKLCVILCPYTMNNVSFPVHHIYIIKRNPGPLTLFVISGLYPIYEMRVISGKYTMLQIVSYQANTPCTKCISYWVCTSCTNCVILSPWPILYACTAFVSYLPVHHVQTVCHIGPYTMYTLSKVIQVHLSQ